MNNHPDIVCQKNTQLLNEPTLLMICIIYNIFKTII